MDHKWLDHILVGQFESPIPRLRICNGRGIECKGQGVFRWCKESGCSMEAFTDGGKTVLESMNRPPCSPGTMIPDDYYLSLQGETDSGWRFRVDRMFPNKFRVGIGQAEVQWRIPQTDLLGAAEFTRESGDDQKRIDLILSPASLRVWPRCSKTTLDNPWFGKTMDRRDWLQFEHDGGTVAATVFGDDCIRVKVKGATCATEKVPTAVVMAFSFLMGRNVNPVVVESITDEAIVRSFQRPWSELRQRRFARPLQSHGMCEKGLAVCMNLFTSEKGDALADHLHACLDATDNGFTSKSLVVTAAVEGMTNLLSNGGQIQGIKKENKKAVIKVLREGDAGDDVVRRLEGFMGNMGRPRVEDILRRWWKNQVLGVSEADFVAWKEIRNKVSHGGVLMRDGVATKDRQKWLTQLDSLCNLVNKLVLQAAGYDGTFYDSSRREVMDFPLCEPDEL